jgi:hypothetical protein
MDKEMPMKSQMKWISGWYRSTRPTWHPTRENRREPQVMMPQKVDLALPKTTLQEIAVPASINGRSLANGRP